MILKIDIAHDIMYILILCTQFVIYGFLWKINLSDVVRTPFFQSIYLFCNVKYRSGPRLELEKGHGLFGPCTLSQEVWHRYIMTKFTNSNITVKYDYCKWCLWFYSLIKSCTCKPFCINNCFSASSNRWSCLKCVPFAAGKCWITFWQHKTDSSGA